MAANSWLTNSEWDALQKSTRPSTLSLAEFQTLCLDGESTVFQRPAMDKILKSLQRFLTTRGCMKDASAKVYGKKQDVADEIQRLTRLDLRIQNGTATAGQALPAAAPPLPPSSTAPAGPRTAGSGGPPTAPKPVATLVPQPTKVKTAVPLTQNEASRILAQVQSSGTKGRGSFTHDGGQSAVSMALGLGGAKVKASPFAHYESPLLDMTTLKRVSLKSGPTNFTFEIPEEHQAAVMKRTKKLLLVPTTSLAAPHVWPQGKDIYVYVNGTGVTTAWRRAWPGTASRKLEVSYLPLDITTFVKSDATQQRISFDCFAKDYYSQVHLVIATPRSDQDVGKALLQEQMKDGPGGDHDRVVQAMYTAINGDSQAEDAEVVTGDQSVSLKDPLSQLPIQIPVRGTSCRHMQPVDLCSALVVLHKGCFWNCPKCDQKLRLKDMVIDTILYRQLQGTQPRGVASIKGVTYVRLDRATNSWVVDKRKCGDAVALDDSDDEAADTNGSNAGQGLAEAAGKSQESTITALSPLAAAPVQLVPVAVSTRGKRNRGTEDCPIELD